MSELEDALFAQGHRRLIVVGDLNYKDGAAHDPDCPCQWRLVEHLRSFHKCEDHPGDDICFALGALSPMRPKQDGSWRKAFGIVNLAERPEDIVRRMRGGDNTPDTRAAKHE